MCQGSMHWQLEIFERGKQPFQSEHKFASGMVLNRKITKDKEGTEKAHKEHKATS